MDTRLREIIEKQKAHPGDVQNQAHLEREFERLDTTPTERANVLATIRYPEWLQRNSITYKEVLEAFKDDAEAKNIFIQQDINPIKYRYSDLREGKNRQPLDQIRAVILDRELFQENTITIIVGNEVVDEDRALLPIKLPNLHTVDLSLLGSLEEVLREFPAITYLLPYQGKKRMIIAPLGIGGVMNIDGLAEIKSLEWEMFIEEITIDFLDDKTATILGEVISCENIDIRTFTDISDIGLAALGKIKKLRMLNIENGGEKITEIGLENLIRDSNLEELGLTGSKNLSGVAFANNKKGPHGIKKLRLPIGKTNDGLQTIVENCPELTELNISNSNITSETFSHLTKIKNLKVLNVSYCGGLDDRAIKIISGIQTLEAVCLFGAIITNEDLGNLTNLVNLTSLGLSDCEGMTRAGLDAFKKKLPQCEIADEKYINFED